uniref:Uncharacterized protein n=1 Tax=Gopherus evgoodei TaxID=1825980 RepID=A0A8C4Y635_9SAUR
IMSPLHALLFSLLFIAASQAQDAGSRTLQPWLVGLTAVVVFLCIVVVLMIINRVWCSKKHRWDPFWCLSGAYSTYRDTPGLCVLLVLLPQGAQGTECVQSTKSLLRQAIAAKMGRATCS